MFLAKGLKQFPPKFQLHFTQTCCHAYIAAKLLYRIRYLNHTSSLEASLLTLNAEEKGEEKKYQQSHGIIIYFDERFEASLSVLRDQCYKDVEGY